MSSRLFLGRTRARSQALQLLFQAEATERSVSQVLAGPYALSDGPLDEYGEQLALGADAMRHELDERIGGASRNWTVSRMPSVDRNILRLALYEMLAVDEVAIAVSIDESVELAKAYGTDESSRFINGLLGSIASELEETDTDEPGAEETDAEEPIAQGELLENVDSEEAVAQDSAADESGA